MKLSQRRLWLVGGVLIAAIVLITLGIAPAKNLRNSGSTFNRAPDGYGAWYAFMAERGTPVKRWQKPFSDLANNQDPKSPMTLLRVQSGLTVESLSSEEQQWVERGNILVSLGIKTPVTEAPFNTRLNSPAGDIKIDTTRRALNVQESILNDRFGAIVWQEQLGEGRIIFATTPYLAANAYQDFKGNYEFLARLVTQSGAGPLKIKGLKPIYNPLNPLPSATLIANSQVSIAKDSLSNQIWVDEYLHGYKDPEVINRETGENIASYLVKTPLFPAFIQGLIFLAVAIFAHNRRFGQSATLLTPTVDNSAAYIQALAGVLQKANSTDFVVETLGKEEQLQLQKALFLGPVPLDPKSIINAWAQQTGRPVAELEQLLQMPPKKRRFSEKDLLMWLNKWGQIRTHFPSHRTNQ